jgi:dolichol-phosphate mannosyltransferase
MTARRTDTGPLRLSVVIPAHQEELSLGACLDGLTGVLQRHRIPHEIVVVDDASTDDTSRVARARAEADPAIRCIRRSPPAGFGRAVRAGLAAASGDVVVIFMADLSDHPDDVVAYYRKIEEGYDCVFGSRFVRGSAVDHYPIVKLVANRIVNRLIQALFWTRFNDLTNAFKAYRADVIRECGPYCASHFNITIEMSLGALIRGYSIAQIPIHWSGRTWGSSNLKLREMGRRYLCVLLKTFFEKVLVADDLLAERDARRSPEVAPAADAGDGHLAPGRPARATDLRP